MLYQITFKGTITKVGDDPQQIRQVAYVEGSSTTEASANLIDALTKDSTIGIRVDSIESISKSAVTEIHFDDSKQENFFRVRIGFKDPSDKKFKFTYIIVQEDDLLGAVTSADSIGRNSPQAAYTVYSATETANLILKSLVGDYAIV